MKRTSSIRPNKLLSLKRSLSRNKTESLILSSRKSLNYKVTKLTSKAKSNNSKESLEKSEANLARLTNNSNP